SSSSNTTPSTTAPTTPAVIIALRRRSSAVSPKMLVCPAATTAGPRFDSAGSAASAPEPNARPAATAAIRVLACFMFRLLPGFEQGRFVGRRPQSGQDLSRNPVFPAVGRRPSRATMGCMTALLLTAAFSFLMIVGSIVFVPLLVV